MSIVVEIDVRPFLPRHRPALARFLLDIALASVAQVVAAVEFLDQFSAGPRDGTEDVEDVPVA